MLFRWSQNNNKTKKNIISLPGKTSICQGLAPRSPDIDSSGRVTSCTSGIWKKGSLTIEAACVLPLFFLTVVSMIGLMGIYAQFAKEMVSLQQQAEKLAMVQVYTSKESSSAIRLYGSVKSELLFVPFDTGILKARVAASVLPWTGRSDYSSLEASNSSEGCLYYLSDYQSVYHTSSCCSYLSLQISAVKTDSVNKHGEHYSGCEKCVGSGAVNAVVYVTENGEHYHNSPECSGLKRSIHLVEESEIAGLQMCSRCRKREAVS